MMEFDRARAKVLQTSFADDIKVAYDAKGVPEFPSGLQGRYIKRLEGVGMRISGKVKQAYTQLSNIDKLIREPHFLADEEEWLWKVGKARESLDAEVGEADREFLVEPVSLFVGLFEEYVENHKRAFAELTFDCEPALNDERCRIDSSGIARFDLAVRIRHPSFDKRIKLESLTGKILTDSCTTEQGGRVLEFEDAEFGRDLYKMLEISVSEDDWRAGVCSLQVEFTINAGAGVSRVQKTKINVPLTCPTTAEILNLYGRSEALADRFVGRETDLSAVLSGLSGGACTGTVVIGQRKTGKSSFVRKVESLAPESVFLLRVTMYSDQRFDGGRNERHPLDRLVSLLEKDAKGKGYTVGDSHDPEQRLSALVSHSRRIGKTLLIIVDEYQRLYAGYHDKDFHGRSEVDAVTNRMRSLVTEGEAHVLIAAQDAFLDYSEAANSLAPFSKRRMKYFSREETAKLVGLSDLRIGARRYSRLDNRSVEWLWTITGGNPFFLQMICGEIMARLYDAKCVPVWSMARCRDLEEEMTNPDLTIFRHTDFESFFGLKLKIVPDEKVLLDLYIRMACGKPVDDCRHILAEINERREIVDSGYRCRMPLFMKWLARRPKDALRPGLFYREEADRI